MDATVFAAVLAAALMHAGWNAVVKIGIDRFSSMLLLALVQGAISLALMPFLPLPAGPSWPWLAASVALHTGYKLVLVKAYDHGDFSQVYPLTRGVAPVAVAVAGVFVLGEAISPTKALAISVLALGVVLMSAKGGRDLGSIPPRALGYALLTAAFTASYTLVDGSGARLSGSASGYAVWMFAGDALGMAACAAAARDRGRYLRVLVGGGATPVGRLWRDGAAAGAMSLGSYWIALWAFTQAPVAHVAALRETSVLFAMLIAVFLMRERAGPWRWTAAAMIGGGVVLMRA